MEHAGAEVRDYLLRQLEIAWALTSHHLNGLTTEECLWRPAKTGLHVHKGKDGVWRADWPEHERYDLGPASIAWLTWHLGLWWSMVLDHTFGTATLKREDVAWPGTADGVRQMVEELEEKWRTILDQADDKELHTTDLVKWPFREKALGDLFAWANVELMKSAAEIGYARFLYAARER